VTDLSAALEKLSDATFMMETSYGSSRDSSYPDGYAASLCGRAIGDANKHPAPSTFRKLTAPKIYEVMRNRRESESKMEQICKRLSYRSHLLSMDINIRASSSFATDDLPFLKRIIPEEVALISSDLYANASNLVVLDGNCPNNIDHQLSIQLEQQKEVLTRDDIVDDSSESDGDGDDDGHKADSYTTVSNDVGCSERSSLVSQDLTEYISKRAEPEVIVID